MSDESKNFGAQNYNKITPDKSLLRIKIVQSPGHVLFRTEGRRSGTQKTRIDKRLCALCVPDLRPSVRNLK